jgi:putative transposase
MYQGTLFSAIVKLIDRNFAEKSARSHRTDRYSKSFKSWQHLIAMLHCPFSGSASLREGVQSYQNHSQAHYHLNLRSLKLSTLSEANSKRNPAFFKDIATSLMDRCQSLNKDLDSLLRLIDASPIIVKGRNNQWTKDTRCARINGLKLHLMIEADNKTIDYFDITHAKVNDVTAGLNIPLEANRIYIFDKGYCDYNWWKMIHDRGSVFVTRLKANARYKVTTTHVISEDHKDFILSDQTITLTNKTPRAGKINHLAGVCLRLIKVARVDKDPLILVCNDLNCAADIIAGHYKARWGIELFFKWMKRYLKVKTFLGESENSIKIQLYTAIIAYLLLWLWKKLTNLSVDTITHLRLFVQTKLFTDPFNCLVPDYDGMDLY